VGDLFAHVPPCPFDGVELGAVRRQEHKLDLGGCEPCLQLFCVMIADVIQDDDDLGGRSIGAQHLLEVLLESSLVPPVGETHGDLPGLAVDGPEPGLALPFALLAHRFGLHPPLGPLVAYGGGVGQRELILEKKNGLRAFPQEFFLTAP
jgi:hypothetical protein